MINIAYGKRSNTYMMSVTKLVMGLVKTAIFFKMLKELENYHEPLIPKLSKMALSFI